MHTTFYIDYYKSFTVTITSVVLPKECFWWH